MGWEFEVLELISKRQKDIGTKCSWDIWLLGQKVFGTFGVWDKSLDFQIFLGHMALGQNVIGTIYLWAARFWDNSPRDKRYWDKRYWENHQGTISLGLFTVHRYYLVKYDEDFHCLLFYC